MEQLQIGGSLYDVYADIAIADDYLNAETWAEDWRCAEGEDSKGRALVTATRTLDKLSWAGTKSSSAQPLEWPRSGTGLSTDLVPDSNSVPQRIIDACCVLAGLSLSGIDFLTQPSTASQRVKRQAAGSVSIEYFKDTFDIEGTRLPTQAWELIAPLFASSSVMAGSCGSGLGTASRFSDENRPIGGYPAD